MICFFVQITKLGALFLCIFAKPLVRFLFSGRIITCAAKRTKKQGSPRYLRSYPVLSTLYGIHFLTFSSLLFLKDKQFAEYIVGNDNQHRGNKGCDYHVDSHDIAQKLHHHRVQYQRGNSGKHKIK